MVEHKRIKLSEIDKNIFRPNDTDVLDSDNSIDPITIIYTIKGQEDELDDNGFPLLYDEERERMGKITFIKAELSDDAYAKKTFNGKRYRYYAKINQRGDLYNKYGLYEEGKINKKRVTGELTWQFREVNLRVFELYLSFLKTKNVAWLKKAERSYK